MIRREMGSGGGGDISGTGVIGQLAEFVTDTKTLQAAKIIGPAVNILTLTNAAAATLALNITAAKTLTLLATDNYTLTVPGTGQAVIHTSPTVAGYVPFFSGTTGIVTSDAGLFWDNTNKRLGIGTTGPGAKLEVTDGTNSIKLSPSTGKIFASGSASTAGQTPGLELRFNADTEPVFAFHAYSHDNVALVFDAYVSATSWVSSDVGSNFAIYKYADQLAIGFNVGTTKGSDFSGFNITTGAIFSKTGSLGVGGAPGSAKLYVNGNVGIGTVSPGAALHVSSATLPIAIFDTYGAINTTSGFHVRAARGTAAAPTAVQADDFILPMAGSGYGATGFSAAPKVAVYGKAAENWTNAAQGTYIVFETTLIGSTTRSEKVRILDNGNVGFATTTPTNLISLGGTSARIIWMERRSAANSAGNTLTITAGGATAAATNKAGGALILQGGLSTGSAESGVTIQGCVAGASGTTDRTQTTMIQVLGNKLGFMNTAAVVQQTGCAVPTDLASAIASITVLRTALNNYGLTTVV